MSFAIHLCVRQTWISERSELFALTIRSGRGIFLWWKDLFTFSASWKKHCWPKLIRDLCSSSSAVLVFVNWIELPPLCLLQFIEELTFRYFAHHALNQYITKVFSRHITVLFTIRKLWKRPSWISLNLITAFFGWLLIICASVYKVTESLSKISNVAGLAL